MTDKLPSHVLILDAFGRNPTRIKVVNTTPAGGVYGDDDRGIRHYTPTRSRIIVEDLFHPIMPGDFR